MTKITKDEANAATYRRLEALKEAELEKVYNGIQRAINDGKFHLYTEELYSETIEALKENGYTIKIDYDNCITTYNVYPVKRTIISWED